MSNVHLNQKKKERRGNWGRKKEEEEEEEATSKRKEIKNFKKKERGEKSNVQTKPMCKCTRGIFVHYTTLFSRFSFFSILGRKLVSF